MFRYIPPIPSFIRAFIKKGCCILSKAFPASIEIASVYVVYEIYGFPYVEPIPASLE
jgi:hypothetical protein